MKRSAPHPGSLPLAATVLGWALTAPVHGQLGQSTYSRLVDEADAIVTATALHAPRTVQGTAGHHEVRFKVRQRWLGTAPGAIALTEPRGRSCGRALHSVAPGVGYLLFLVNRDGAFRLATGTARAAVPLTPERLTHVRSLLDAKGRDEARLSVLAEALGATDQRIRRDAALAIARDPALAAHPTTCAKALDRALRTNWRSTRDHGHTVVDPMVSALVTASARLRSRTLGELCAVTLTAESVDHPALLDLAVHGARLLPGATMVPQLENRWARAGDAAKLRAASWLDRLPADPATIAWWQRLATSTKPSLALAATRALLRNGANAAPPGTSAAVLDAARSTAPAFRFVRPRRRPVDPVPLKRR